MNHLRNRTGTARSKHTGHRVIAAAGGVAVIAMVAMTAGCEGTGNQAPSTSTTTTTTTSLSATTTAPSASPTEKNINPTGGNLLTPQVIAPPAPTEPPGVHRHRQN